MTDIATLLKDKIRDVPDFPKPGILFKDITTALQDGPTLKATIEALANATKDLDFDVIVGMESRGFIYGTALAFHLGKGFVPVRKPGKLPAAKTAVSYELEYGSDTLEIHTDALKEGQRALIVDDLLATGGTAAATVKLLEKIGGTVAGLVFVIELGFIPGRDKLPGQTIRSLVTF